MTQLLLMRHAVNDYVKTRRLAGWTPGVHLNDEGRRQAEALRDRLADVPLAAIISSPLERALETAEIVAETHDLEIETWPDLGEVRYGEWTGQKLETLAKTALWKHVQIRPSRTRFPGGESIFEVQARVVGALEKICATYPKGIVAAVAHADVIKLATAHYLGLPLDLYQRLIVAPASLTVLRDGSFDTRLITLNDTAHLATRPEIPPPEHNAKEKGENHV